MILIPSFALHNIYNPQVEHRLKHTLESFRQYIHASHGLHPEERTMDFLMELPLEIGRPTGPEKEPGVKNEGEKDEGEDEADTEDEDSYVVRMVEGCADNWEFKDWKKVRLLIFLLFLCL